MSGSYRGMVLKLEKGWVGELVKMEEGMDGWVSPLVGRSLVPQVNGELKVNILSRSLE